MADEENPPPRHVRNEIETRKHYGLAGTGADLHPAMCIAFCGANASSQWFFQGVDHVVNSLLNASSVAPCVECLGEIASIIEDEIEGDMIAERPRKPDRKRVDAGNWRRAAGDSVCVHCELPYYDHDDVRGYRWLRRLCNGELVKL